MSEERGEYRVVPGESRLMAYQDSGIQLVGARTMVPAKLGAERVEALKRTYFKNLDDGEMAVALAVTERTGLSPEARQIFFIKRWDAQAKREVMQPQISIDGFRLIAERTGNYMGQLGPWWCGDDGVWVDVWLSKAPPAAAKIAVLHRQFREPLTAVARFDSYAQRTKDGTLARMWAAMPDLMIAKCVEGLALRRAFPQELSGLYTDTEMMQAVEVDGTIDGGRIAGLSVRPETARALERGVDDAQRALAALHATAADLGLSHDDIKQMVSEETGKTVGSMTGWDIKQIGWARGLVERKGRLWIEEQHRDEVIDAETGEIVPAEDADDIEFPYAPASMLTHADEQAGLDGPDRSTN